ncbi:diguanylate cyclase (GGDEF) domain-containing protein [Nocardia nova SH22a]|uniref:Diguanylate cyclase (GGDEF) domain-containing protein n=1 Tax=Nocardia nova SH22a TaxID=1415166 RepID=W5TGT0_9NOCA|nr:diguanylate cyclase (GGDEF) domain-containing protein [Nocardia nova SH22a]
MTFGTQHHHITRIRSSWPSEKLWRTLLSAAIVAIVVVVSVVDSPIPALGAMVTVVLASLAMIGIGVRRYRPPMPTAWYLLAASAVLFAAGTILRVFADSGLPPFDDLATLAGYTGVGVAAFLWLCPRRAGSQRDLLLDSGLIALGALLASWTFLISPVLHSTRQWDASALVMPVYPVIDALLLTLVTHSMVTSSRSETSLRLVHLGLLAILIADLGYNLRSARSLHIDDRVLLLPLLLAYGIVGLAALHPTMVTLGDARRIHPNRSRQRASVITVTLVVASLVPTVGARSGTVDRVVVSTLLATLLVGVLVRSERAIVRSARSERRAQYQADHDMLTGLLNRSALLRTPAHDQELWSGRPIALLFLDLDGFKTVNDSYGHAVGDELIANAAARIRRVIQRDDIAARYGGDEFVVLAGVTRAEAAVLAEKLLAAFVKPFELSVAEVTMGVSIGISCGGPRSADATVYDLLREADSAMYHAKDYALGCAFHDDLRHLPQTESRRRMHRHEPAV